MHTFHYKLYIYAYKLGYQGKENKESVLGILGRPSGSQIGADSGVLQQEQKFICRLANNTNM